MFLKNTVFYPMVSHIPSFWFAGFYKTSEDASICDISCGGWGAFGGLMM